MKQPTLQSLIQDLENAKTLASSQGQPTGIIQAVALQAKLLGLDIKTHSETHSAQPAQIIVNVIDAKKSSSQRG